MWFSEGLSKLPVEMRTIKPTFFLAPPRVWERVYSSISVEIRKRPARDAEAVLPRRRHWDRKPPACASRRKPVPAWMRAALRGFDKIMFAKIRERLGGRIRVAASGAAPLGKDLAEFYAAIGMPLIEGYGLTEGGVAALNPLDRPKSGSIGKLLPGVEARIEDDGELLLRAPCLFSGYFNDPAATAAVLRDGWLATGDIAEMDAEGYFYITGRKKELIVSSNGKKIYPARIEALLKREPLDQPRAPDRRSSALRLRAGQRQCPGHQAGGSPARGGRGGQNRESRAGRVRAHPQIQDPRPGIFDRAGRA